MTKTLYAEFTVKAGSEARVAEMMVELTRHVRNESGNELFLPYTREENPPEYFVRALGPPRGACSRFPGGRDLSRHRPAWRGSFRGQRGPELGQTNIDALLTARLVRPVEVINDSDVAGLQKRVTALVPGLPVPSS